MLEELLDSGRLADGEQVLDADGGYSRADREDGQDDGTSVPAVIRGAGEWMNGAVNSLISIASCGTTNLEVTKQERPSFDAITATPLPIDTIPRRWTNFLDLTSAIECFTPVSVSFCTVLRPSNCMRCSLS